MPSGKNWVNFIYVNLAFAIYAAGVFYYNQLSAIKSNWPLYRCNPMYMPFADDVESNFAYCIQNMQTDFMGYLLQPLTYVTSSISHILGGFTNDINMVRAMFDKVRTFMSSSIQSVFGVFLNLVIEFQKITISIKDLIGKTIGIMVSLMYVMDGSVKTMQSTWNGPPGQLVRAIGSCFHPDTKIKTKNGEIYKMKDIPLGSILEDGSKVFSVLKIDNSKKESLYKINEGVNGEPIYVTGSHFIQKNKSFTHEFIQVKDCQLAILQQEVYSDWFSCLITTNRRIQIEKHIFWDWEDDELTKQ